MTHQFILVIEVLLQQNKNKATLNYEHILTIESFVTCE